MKISFNINFHTVWGQNLHITGSLPELGAWDTGSAREMHHLGNGDWWLEIELPDNPVTFEYRYFLSADHKLIFEEWQKNHKLNVTDTKQDYTLMDYWQNRPANMAFYSSAFTKSWFAHPCNKFERIVKSTKRLCIKAMAPEINQDHSLAIAGNQAELGDWNIDKALIMNCDSFPEWSIELDAGKFTASPVEYKLYVINNEDKSLFQWEKGENRILNIPPVEENETVVVSGIHFRNDSTEWKCAGTVIPVFSLRSANSFGIGDFADLKMCIDWLKRTSQKILQVLPLNDTTQTHSWTDSYPYNAISVHALHPIYLHLESMGTLNDSSRRDLYKGIQQELNALNEIDYDRVDQFKWMYFREIYRQEGEVVLQSPTFLSFFNENKDWLIPYAAYSYLRDVNHTADFRLWDAPFNCYVHETIETFCHPDKPHYPEIALYYYLQFHLHNQLLQVKEYAHLRGIVLKGDIPIGVSKTSVEVWSEPQYFNLNCQTGAPPDDFSIYGQNWGFPTYNWDKLEEDDFRWWKKRFGKMSTYFDAYRIDHILGFFRIWEIPEHSVQGLLGCFNPALPLSVEEIENAGFNFVPEKFTQAHIGEAFLPELFGEYTQEALALYLDRTSSGYFIPKEPFDTQLKIKAFFADKHDEKGRLIRDGLYAVCNEVLFIEDRQKPAHFHPRISAASSCAYRELDNSDKYAFDYLYRHYFYQRHNEFWKEEAYKKLIPFISCTDMLTCGEDLGMIPHCVPEVMQKLQIFSLEIERMPKESNVEFTHLQRLPYHSVCTTSTHDMSTIRMWWKEDKERTQRYYNKALMREGLAPEDCSTEICKQIIFNHLQTRSMLTIVPLQDWLSIDKATRRANENEERINVPAHSCHYWNYRIHLFLEELLTAHELNGQIQDLILSSGR